MTDRQKELLQVLGDNLILLSMECEKDENFYELIAENGHLFPMSLDELSKEITSLY